MEKFEFLRQQHRVIGDSLGMAGRIVVADFHCPGQGGDGLHELIALLLDQQSDFDADGSTGGNRIGQAKVFLAEWFLERATIEMENAQPFAG